MDSKELVDKLQECEVVKFGDFTLTSGIKSRYYVDVKMATTKPKILGLICRHILKVIDERNIKVDYIACIELGSVPIGTVVSFITNIDLLIIRKVQNHGLTSRVVGNIEKSKTVLLVEDVTATGESVVSAAKILRGEGLIVDTVVSVVDRGEGADKNLENEGLKLIYLVEARKLLQVCEVAESLLTVL